MQVPNKIVSIDAETDGLWGKPFAIAAVVYEYRAAMDRGVDGKRPAGFAVTDQLLVRLPDAEVTNEWVKENVLPSISGVIVTHNDYEEMLSAFSIFYNAHKSGTVLWHMGHVVESFLFRECVRLGYIGEWDAPYTPIDVSMTLREKGYDPASVDAVMDSLGLMKPLGSTHDPMYDCICAFRVWERLNGF